jgi:hypothetical protein
MHITEMSKAARAQTRPHLGQAGKGEVHRALLAPLEADRAGEAGRNVNYSPLPHFPGLQLLFSHVQESGGCRDLLPRERLQLAKVNCEYA